jgi:hypothetical protein
MRVRQDEFLVWDSGSGLNRLLICSEAAEIFWSGKSGDCPFPAWETNARRWAGLRPNRQETAANHAMPASGF